MHTSIFTNGKLQKISYSKEMEGVIQSPDSSQGHILTPLNDSSMSPYLHPKVKFQIS